MKTRYGLAWPLAFAFAASAGAQTADLKWHKDVTKDVEAAVKLAATDPVSAHRLLQQVQSRKKPTPAQAAWLQEQLAALQPRAFEILQHDYQAAATAGDLRGALFAAGAISEAIDQKALPKDHTLEEVRKRALAADPASGIWKLSDLSATTAKRYGEGGVSGFNVSGPKGSHVLRVKGKVENVGEGSDPSYALWALGPLKRIMGSISGTGEPHRWLDQDLMFLVNPAGELIKCAVIGKDSELASMQLRAGNNLVFPPKALKRGDSLKLDAVFVVPEAPAEYRLFIVGGPLVPVPAPTTP